MLAVIFRLAASDTEKAWRRISAPSFCATGIAASSPVSTSTTGIPRRRSGTRSRWNDRPVHYLGELAQHLIAAAVPILIVDGLEVVDVQQQHGKRGMLTRGDGDLAADDRGQEAPVQHVGERIAAALDFRHHVEQTVEQVLDARHQFLQLAHQSGMAPCPSAPRISPGSTTSSSRATASMICRSAGALNSTPPLWCNHRPNSEAAARQHLLRRAVVQADQHGLAPFEQRGAPLALGGDVLPQREQPVGLVVARAAVDVAHEGAAHLLDRRRTDCRRTAWPPTRPCRPVAGAQAQRDLVLQDARAGHHQMNGDVHARVDLADLFCVAISAAISPGRARRAGP